MGSSIWLLYTLTLCLSLSSSFAFLPLQHVDIKRHNPSMIIITTTPITAIQMTLLDAKNPFDLPDFSVTEAEGPFACFWGASATGGKLGNGEMAGGGEGMIDVLKGFPSFLQNTCYHYKQIKNKDYTIQIENAKWTGMENHPSTFQITSEYIASTITMTCTIWLMRFLCLWMWTCSL